MENVQVYQDLRGEWRWRLVAKNGRIIADSSEGYTRQADCLEAVNRVADAFIDGHSTEIVGGVE
jgi:uncharacterized protein YegP (UPF0339 family)